MSGRRTRQEKMFDAMLHGPGLVELSGASQSYEPPVWCNLPLEGENSAICFGDTGAGARDFFMVDSFPNDTDGLGAVNSSHLSQPVNLLQDGHMTAAEHNQQHYGGVEQYDDTNYADSGQTDAQEYHRYEDNPHADGGVHFHDTGHAIDINHEDHHGMATSKDAKVHTAGDLVSQETRFDWWDTSAATSVSSDQQLANPICMHGVAEPVRKGGCTAQATTSRASPSHLVSACHAVSLAVLQGVARGDLKNVRRDAVQNASSVTPVGGLLVHEYFMRDEGARDDSNAKAKIKEYEEVLEQFESAEAKAQGTGILSTLPSLDDQQVPELPWRPIEKIEGLDDQQVPELPWRPIGGVDGPSMTASARIYSW